MALGPRHAAIRRTTTRETAQLREEIQSHDGARGKR
jgi:hypothetical protein